MPPNDYETPSPDDRSDPAWLAALKAGKALGAHAVAADGSVLHHRSGRLPPAVPRLCLSNRMKPIHAGLLGSDCLILLDEAHLAVPFRQTLKAVAVRGAADGEGAALRRWPVVGLSATPYGADIDRLELRPEDIDAYGSRLRSNGGEDGPPLIVAPPRPSRPGPISTSTGGSPRRRPWTACASASDG